ncbi:glutathione S-transferase [Stagonosporopsis vannaccii]|nr:glutathione S-transferase [Stagonosporopsis vannaccii]
MPEAPIITFDYDFSPYGQKIRTALAASGVPFHRSDQPIVLPRPILEKFDITYRRIPLLAFGRDIYADSSLIIDELQTRYNALPTTPADKAYEIFGAQIFASALNIIPTAALTPEFVKDRLTIFPGLANPSYAELRPSGLAEMKAKFSIIENEFLGSSLGAFISGEKFGLADIHAGWAVGWALKAIGLGQEPGFGENDFPRIYKWVASWPKPQYTDVSQEQLLDIMKSAAYTTKDIGVNDRDPLGIKAGTDVTVENSDTEFGAHPQKGKLVGVNDREIVLELKNGIRVHFPRIGYLVKEAKIAGLASRFGLS